jgi:hypothetical protein
LAAILPASFITHPSFFILHMALLLEIHEGALLLLLLQLESSAT